MIWPTQRRSSSPWTSSANRQAPPSILGQHACDVSGPANAFPLAEPGPSGDPCHDGSHPPLPAGAPRNAVTRTPRAASAPLGLPEGDHACAQVTTTPPVVRRWLGSAAGASCARPPPPPPLAPPGRSPGRRWPKRALPAPRATAATGSPRPDQHPAVHPARPAGHRPGGHPPGTGRHRLHPSRARRLRRPHRHRVQGHPGRRRAAGNLGPRPDPPALRPGGLERLAGRRHHPRVALHRAPFFGINFATGEVTRTTAPWRAFARDLNRAGRMARVPG